MNVAMTQTYRSQYLRPLGLLEQNFRQCANLVASAEVYEVRRTWGYDVFEKQASFIEQHILSGFH